MSIKRITISVPEELVDRIKAAAGDEPVSTWVTELVEQELDHEEADRLWEEFMAEVGPIPDEAQAWVDHLMESLQSRDDQRAKRDSTRDVA